MLSPAKLITGGVLVFAIGSALAIARPFDGPGTSAPGAAVDPELMKPAAVAGSFTAFFESGSFPPDPDTAGFNAPPPLRVTLDGDDPRLQVAGTLHAGEWWVEPEDPDGALEKAVEFGTWVLAGESGTWSGTGVGVGSATVLELEGAGAYAGLTASLLLEWDGPDAFSFDGAIVTTELFPNPS